MTGRPTKSSSAETAQSGIAGDGGARGRLDRRAAVKLAVAALAGAGASILSPSAAWATTGTMQFGADNDAGPSKTQLLSSSTLGTLVVACSGTTSGANAIYGYVGPGMPTAAAIVGKSGGSGPGVHGICENVTSGYGLVAEGGVAQLRLVPSDYYSGTPTFGAHQLGDVYVDKNGIFYRCVAAGSPGVFAPVRSTVLLPVPVRAVDTRNGTGGVFGPLPAMIWYNFGVLAAAGVPSQAVALLGNLTMVAPSKSRLLDGKAWMAILPATHTAGSSASDPGVSTVNAGYNTYATANQFSVGLGAASYAGKFSVVFQAAMKLNFIVDIAGYVI